MRVLFPSYLCYFVFVCSYSLPLFLDWGSRRGGGKETCAGIFQPLLSLQTSGSFVKIPCGFLSSSWATIAIDAKLLLSKYASLDFVCLKGVEFCSNMSVRNVFTSDNVYSYQVCGTLTPFFPL